ncbi:MAG TPA: precorrin-3B C(17)-methyltransferase, partial [Chloroflexota bacterium]
VSSPGTQRVTRPTDSRLGRGVVHDVATFAVGRRGAEIAGKIAQATSGDLYVPERWLDQTREPALGLPEGTFGEQVRSAFARYRALILVVPVGVAVRTLAPVLKDKRSDPAIVVVDEAGRHAIALLSGHLGGANQLAHEVAAVIGAQPVVTTAAEVLDKLALDLLGQEWGWSIENGTAVTRASAALISDEPMGGYQDAGEEDWWQEAPPNITRFESIAALLAAPVAARIVISDGVLPEVDPQATCVVFRPRTLVLGVGSVRGITAGELDDLIIATLDEAGLAPASVRELATIELKADEAGITDLAARHRWPVRYFSAEQLAGIQGPSGSSSIVRDAVGTGAVCEPAALLAAGATELIVPKARTQRATVAVARVARQSALGHLAIVGLGPGGPDDLTRRGRDALERAQVIVGYEGYLDLVRPWLGFKAYHGSPIGDEIERCSLALDLVERDQRVALVSSGDAGIYGMAGLVFELIDQRGASKLAARVEIVPGVSAAQAAAALLGAPLMSDFAAISLSDLMTPWSVIEKRIEAAAGSDLVVVFYNPASARRQSQLARARDLLLQHRVLTTPVGLVRNASRPGQAVTITDLDHLLDNQIDMLTTVIVGNSASVHIGDRIITRRGYPLVSPLSPTLPRQGGESSGP